MNARHVLVSAALALAGCSAIVDGHIGSLEPNLNQKRDIAVTIRDFTAHEGQLVDIMIVQPENQQIQARMVIDPVPVGGTFLVDLPRAASVRATRVDFYADANEDRTLDPPTAGGDHVWREELDAQGRLTFIHSFEFVDIVNIEPPQAVLNDLRVRITGAEEFGAAPVIGAMVRDDELDAGGSVVEEGISGVYVLPGFENGVVEFTIASVVDGGEEYRIELGFNAGTVRCTSPTIRSPATGAFVVELARSQLDCSAPARARPLFVDLGR